MTHFYMIYTDAYGFELMVFETQLEADQGVDKLRRYSGYKELAIDIVRVEPNIDTAIVSRSLPEEL